MSPVDPGSLVGIAKAFQFLLTPFKWVAGQVHLKYFRFRNRWPWIDKQTAIKKAQFALGLRVVDAMAFQNFKSHRKFIAALTEDGPDSYWKQVFLLEKVGGGFVTVWHSETFGSCQNQIFTVDDIEGNGTYSVTFSEESWGSGLGSRHLYSYSAATQKLSTVEESYNYSNSAAPDYEPEIITDGDENFRHRFIEFATQKGFLKEMELPDFDDPKWAVYRWHYDNVKWFVQGKVNVHRYDGLPVYGDGSKEELETERTKWIAYFKGPLFKVDKERNKHYIVYSPLNRYEWAKTMVGNDEVLFYGCHCVSGLFLYRESDQTITRYCSFQGVPIPMIDTMYMEGSTLVIVPFDDPGTLVRIASIAQLDACYNWCKSVETHGKNGCKVERFTQPELNPSE